MARQTTKKSGTKKQKRNVPNGVAYIQSTFNNSIVTIADQNGDVISWASAGSSGFKGAKKGTPFAAQTAAESAGRRATEQGMRQIEVMVSGPGAGRETAIRALQGDLPTVSGCLTSTKSQRGMPLIPNVHSQNLSHATRAAL